MADTEDQLVALDAAISSGVLSVTFNGRTVTYQRIDDMLKARAILATRLGTNRPYRVGVTNKMGWSTETG